MCVVAAHSVDAASDFDAAAVAAVENDDDDDDCGGW